MRICRTIPGRSLFHQLISEGAGVINFRINPFLQRVKPTFPCYFHPICKEHFHRAIRALGDYIASLLANLKERIVFMQVAEGSTGDGQPYKGIPIDSRYRITESEWGKFRRETWDIWIADYGYYSHKNRRLRKKQSLLLTREAITSAAGPEVVDQPPVTTALPTAPGAAHDDACDNDFRKKCRRTWARMLKKVYEADPLVCTRCGFPMRVLSFIEDPPVVRKILDHLDLWDAGAASPTSHHRAHSVFG